MGPLSTAVAVGCLTALRWLFWLTGALMAALIAKQYLGGEGVVASLAIGAVAFAALGWLSGFAAQKIEEAQNK